MVQWRKMFQPRWYLREILFYDMTIRTVFTAAAPLLVIQYLNIKDVGKQIQVFIMLNGNFQVFKVSGLTSFLWDMEINLRDFVQLFSFEVFSESFLSRRFYF